MIDAKTPDPHALAKVRGEMPSRGGDPAYQRPLGAGRDKRKHHWRHKFTEEDRLVASAARQLYSHGKRNVEGLTKRQEGWINTVTDYRHTLLECARIAGYPHPGRSIQELMDNPVVLRAMLRRFHKQLCDFARVFSPQIKYVKDVPKPKPGVWIRKGQPEERGPSEGVAVDSLLGEGK